MKITFNAGEHTAEDRTLTREGGLRSSVGCFYKPNDSRAHKVSGRTTFADTGAASRVKGLQLAAFDNSTDKVLCYAGTVVYASDAGATGSFSSAATGLDASGTYMIFAHANDKWFACNGVDQNKVFEYVDFNDGNGWTFGSRNMGMSAPAQPLTATAGLGAGTVVRPSNVLSNTRWNDTTYAYDGDLDTFAWTTFPQTNTAAVLELDTIADDGGTTGRTAHVVWRASGSRYDWDANPGRQYEERYQAARFVAEIYDNAAADWITVCQETVYSAHNSWRTSVVDIPDAVDIDNANVRFRLTFRLVTTLNTADVSIQVADCRVQDAPAGAKLSGMVGGIFYIYTEFDEIRWLESAPCNASNRVTVPDDTYNSCTVSGMAAAAQNSNCTHYRIYRSYDDNIDNTTNPPTTTALNNYALVGQVAAGVTSWVDEWEKSPLYRQPEPPQISGVTDGVTWTWYPRDSQPPIAEYMVAYRGSMVLSNGRSLYFTVPGLPESYIEGISQITAFPFEEHDSIVCMQASGESLFVFAQGVVAVMDGTPLVTNGSASVPEVRTLKGQPGCVSRLGATSYSVTGEKRVAWVSRQGIHASDGDSAINLVDDIDWETNVDLDSLSTCTLEWLPNLQCLKLGYDSDGGGTNDRFALIHVFEPKRSTWGHYAGITAISAGETGGIQREYTGNESGVVYLEGGTSDASNAYDGSGNVRFDVQTGRIYAENAGDERMIQVGTCKLLHTDGGSGETVSVVVTAGFDDRSETHSETISVSIDGAGGSDFYVGLAGDWFTFQITHSGKADFGISEIRAGARPMGRTGGVNA